MEARLRDLNAHTPCYLDKECKGTMYRVLNNLEITNPETEEVIHINSKRTVSTVYIDETKLDIETRKRFLANAFNWGPVVAVHTIGEYQIVEYHPRIFEGGRGTSEFDRETTVFSTYINWTSTSHSYESLDHALAGVIDHKHQGPNSQAAVHFMRMIVPWSND